jgi:methionyl-tRNA formyltransferase
MGTDPVHDKTDASSASAASPKPLRNRQSARPQRLILMGTGPFAVPAFEAIREAGHEIALVVTRPVVAVRSRKGPPPSPVRDFAARLGYPVFDPESINTPQSIALLAKLRASLLVVCDYGQILSPEALGVAPLGGINLHGSLLPAYRGAAPVQWAVINGDPVAGVSVIHMTPRLDGGPVLAIAQIPIAANDTSGTLEQKLSLLGVEPTLQSIEQLAQWDQRSPIGTPQDKSRVSRAPRLSKEAGRINWSRSAKEIDCHIRGMQPWPGAFTEVALNDGRPAIRFAVRSATLVSPEPLAADGTQDVYEPGTLIDAQSLIIRAGSAGAIRIERLQPAGRNEVSGVEFLRGYRLQPGTRLG